MTIKECIDLVDAQKPNQYSISEKVMWLTFLDKIIINEVLKTHEGYDGRYDDFVGYSEDDLTASLIVESPYDQLYPAYLKMKIDGENGEQTRYNNSAASYNAYMLEFRKNYNKTHMPLGNGAKRNSGVSVKVDVNLSEAEYEAIRRDVYNALSRDVNEVTSPDKLYDIVMRYMQSNASSFKGDAGKTPIKGTDYFTKEEVEQIKSEVMGNDGFSPTVEIDGNSVENGTRVVITDKSGRHAFVVMNGKNITKMSELTDDVGYVKSVTDKSFIGYIEELNQVLLAARDVDVGISGNNVHLLAKQKNILRSETGAIAADVSNQRIASLADPVDITDAVNKRYVDNILGDIETALDGIITIQTELIGG